MKIKADSDQSFVNFILEQLNDRLELQARRMFGGYGLYADATFFGIVHRSCLYFKTSAETQSRYEAAGMGCFQPNQKQCLKRYYQVPLDVLEGREQLRVWAAEAIQVARADSYTKSRPEVERLSKCNMIEGPLTWLVQPIQPHPRRWVPLSRR